MPKLVEQFLVRHSYDLNDQRRIVARLTASGWKLVEAIIGGSAAIYADLVAAVGRQRLEELQSMLDELIESLDCPQHSNGDARR